MKSSFKKVFLASTKDGYKLKSKIVPALEKAGYDVKDLIVDIGVKDENDKSDVVDVAIELVKAIKGTENAGGIIFTGYGSDAAMVLNKFSGIRCASCHDYYTAKMTREHNDSNVMALGQDCTGHEVAAQMVQIFIEHSILNQPNPEVHQKRIDMMSQQELKQ